MKNEEFTNDDLTAKSSARCIRVGREFKNEPLPKPILQCIMTASLITRASQHSLFDHS
jgi:hypothetical protein